MKPPEIVNATQAELDELLAKAKPTFSSEQYLLLERVFGTFVYVMLSLQNAKTSIKRFQRMLFGHRTEHKRNVLELAAQTGGSDARDAESVPADASTAPFGSVRTRRSALMNLRNSGDTGRRRDDPFSPVSPAGEATSVLI